ncbi:MAG: ATP-binding protein [Clostridia bacterium]|jgi:hypothetical protein
MEIKRDIYLNRLINRRGNGFVKVITGIRRCGKSYLLNNIFYDYLIKSGVPADHILLFAFDSADDLLKIGEDPLLFDNEKTERKADPKKLLKYLEKQISDNEMYYLLLDEVQNLAAFESVLNSFLRKKNLDLYVTGSNSRFLSKDILTEFAGRGDEIHILPLSFFEFFGAYDGSEIEAYDDYSVYGGLPAVALMKNVEQKTAYLSTQMDNVYLRDIIKRYNLQSDNVIGELLDVISSGISALTNPRKLSATFTSVKQSKISEATIDKYIEHMEDAFMINRVKRFDVKGRKYIGTPYKIYFEDVGLRNARLNFRQIEEPHIMENIIYNELRYRGYNVDVGVVESRERDKSGKELRKQLEIDFIATQGSKKYYIQSAYAIPDEVKYAQEIKSFDKVSDSFKKIILVDKSMKIRRDDNGYVMMGVKEFLLDPNSLEN